jgi:hypothetical protein
MMDGWTFRVRRGGVRIQGRGRFGWTQAENWTWPWASLEADGSCIVISFPHRGTVRINREHVLLIEPYDGLIGKGVRFWSDEDDRDVIFWTGDPELIIDSLRMLGWDASD